MSEVIDIKKELGKEDISVNDVNILFLDLSSTCSGYTLVNVDFTKKTSKFINAGAIWFDDSWNHQDKYHYIFNAITSYFNIVGQIDYCVAESYHINPKRLMGCAVGPEMAGVVKVALAEIGVTFSDMTPQQWRKLVGVKPTNINGKKDYKKPTQAVVNTFVQVPTEIPSNITGNMRTTPSDLFDSIALGIGWLKKFEINTMDFKGMQFQESINI
jgi:hypothetical protein